MCDAMVMMFAACFNGKGVSKVNVMTVMLVNSM